MDNPRQKDRVFPCETIDSPTELLVGFPCTFPFKIDDCTIPSPKNPHRSEFCSSFQEKKEIKTFTNCTDMSDSRPWCAVHVFKNKSMTPQGYAYCNTHCNGEMATRERPEYIAGSGFDTLWQNRIFNINSWGGGHCHTYNPNETYLPGRPGNFIARLGPGIQTDSLCGHNIHLHSKKASQQIFKVLNSPRSTSNICLKWTLAKVLNFTINGSS